MARVLKRKLKLSRAKNNGSRHNRKSPSKDKDRGGSDQNSIVGKVIVFVGFGFCGLLLSKCLVTANPFEDLGGVFNKSNSTLSTSSASTVSNAASSLRSASSTEDTTLGSSSSTTPPFVPSETCWSNEAFGGPPWDWNHTQTWEMTPSQCAATQTFWGGSGMDFQKAFQHLTQCQKGRGLKVFVVGGSITTGHSKSFDPRILADYAKAWPAQLQTYLNTHYPCKGGAQKKHEVINRSERSVASDHWMGYFLQARQDRDHFIHKADVILLETASNDFQNWHSPQDSYQTIKYVELIVRILRQLPHNKPIIMWVTVGWRDTHRYKDKPIASCSEAQHLEVMKHYDIPHVSMLQAYQPLDTYFDFLTKYYFADITSHLTILGHQLTGGVVGTRLAKQLTSTTYPPSADLYSLPPALNTKYKADDAHWQNMLQIVDNGADQQHQHITSINFRGPDRPVVGGRIGGLIPITSDLIVYNDGWKFQEDVWGKPGLIANQINAKLVIFIPSLSHDMQWMFTLGVLKSYEHMGAFNLKFWYLMRPKKEDHHYHRYDDGDGDRGREEAEKEAEQHYNEAVQIYDSKYANCNKKDWNASPEFQKQFTSKTIDTLWDTKASVKDVENMVVMKAYVNDAPPDDNLCAWMEIQIRQMRPARTENKIKLLDLTIL